MVVKAIKGGRGSYGSGSPSIMRHTSIPTRFLNLQVSDIVTRLYLQIDSNYHLPPNHNIAEHATLLQGGQGRVYHVLGK